MDIPVFRTNILILQFLQKTALTLICGLYELQGLARTSLQGASGMDKLGHNTAEMRGEQRLHFH
jgi:hypothetical protein